ncbi:homoserine O-acetyltransferase, partial [Halobacteriales archaeon SW_7_71_33]
MTVRFERDSLDLGAFTFERGGRVPRLTVTYEAYGDPADETVLVCHALTGSANVTSVPDDANEDDPDPDRPGLPLGGQARAWWESVVGPGRAVDTEEYHVVCANVPGSCYGSTGPLSTDPVTGEPYGPEFPAVTVGDWTRAQRRLLETLGVERLHAVVGGSLGGMNAVEWAKRYPDRVDRVAPVATAARLDPQALALDAVAARAIASDPNWQGGRYYGGAHPDDGLAIARMIGHLMYLSKPSMRRRFGRRVA